MKKRVNRKNSSVISQLMKVAGAISTVFGYLGRGKDMARQNGSSNSVATGGGNVWDRLANMLRSNKLRGNCFAGSDEQLEPVKQRRKPRVANLSVQLSQPD
jgi:hypothetical protein